MAGTIYLPGVFVPQAFLPARLGVQIEGRVADWSPYLIPNRLYQWPLRWWSYPSDDYDENAAALKGHHQVITLKCVPPEYRLWPEFAGSPPALDCYDAFIAFAQQVIDRYHPCAIELFNEPEVYRDFANNPEFFGAWVGEGESMYQGGQRYGQFCNYVYPRLSGCKVLAGALMMHEESLDFLRGALDAGMRSDGLSFHCYIGQEASFDRLQILAGELRNMTSLPLVCTETSILGDGTPAHEQRKAEYVDYIRSGAWAHVEAANWYALDSEWIYHNDLFTDGRELPAWEEWCK